MTTQRAAERIGFTCAYTPLPLLHAAGLVPFRLLPVSEAPDEAGSVLHDNLCPQVKRILDRAMAGDLPELLAVVLMASCDAMRRLADAWATARPETRLVLLDLPFSEDEQGAEYLGSELERLRALLSGWTGRPVEDREILRSTRLYNELAAGLSRLSAQAGQGKLHGGRMALQELFNRSVTLPPEQILEEVARLESSSVSVPPRGVPLYLFGNVLPLPGAFELFESCGARVVDDDLCTGSRQITSLDLGTDPDGPRLLLRLARALLARPRCGRTMPVLAQGQMSLADSVLDRARACGASGVVAHVMKFCDPYLGRLPLVHKTLRQAGLPFLVLEGDGTLRSLGQHRTRIEAFVEMLTPQGGTP